MKESIQSQNYGSTAAVFTQEKWDAGPYYGSTFMDTGELSRAKEKALEYAGLSLVHDNNGNYHVIKV